MYLKLPSYLKAYLTHLVCTIQMTQSPHSHCQDLHRCISEPPSPQRWGLGTSYRTTGGLVDCSTCSHLLHTAVCPIERPRSKIVYCQSLVLGWLTRNSNQNPQAEMGECCAQYMDRNCHPAIPTSQLRMCTRDVCFQATRR